MKGAFNLIPVCFLFLLIFAAENTRLNCIMNNHEETSAVKKYNSEFNFGLRNSNDNLGHFLDASAILIFFSFAQLSGFN